MSNRMNICFACNNNYFELLMVAIQSIQKKNENLRFYIYFNSDNLSYYQVLTDLVEKNKNEVLFFDKAVINETLPRYLRRHDYISLETYFRLLIPELIKEDRILYLDVDIIVRSSLKQLYSSKVEQFGIGAVPYSPNLSWLVERNLSIKLNHDHPYYNSGVLVLDLVSLRKNKLFVSVLDLIEIQNELNDQDALNMTTKANYYLLGNEYNWSLHDINLNIHPIIVHFAGPHKPNLKFYVHPYSREFRKIYKELFPDNKYTLSIEYISNAFIKANIKRLFRTITRLRPFK